MLYEILLRMYSKGYFYNSSARESVRLYSNYASYCSRCIIGLSAIILYCNSNDNNCVLKF